MQQESIFDTGKVKINYLDYGSPSDEPLVMLHGGAWRWQEYLTLIPKSISKATCVCPGFKREWQIEVRPRKLPTEGLYG